MRGSALLMMIALLFACSGKDEDRDVERLDTLRYNDGRKAAEGRIRGHTRVGEWTFWDAKGAVESKGSYVNGVKQGEWLESAMDYEIDEWVRRRGEYHDGDKTGLWQTRAVSGWLVSEIEMDRSMMNGRYRKYHRNGKLWVEGEWRDNVAIGHWTHWYDTGQKEREEEKEVDAPSRLTRRWYPDGGLQYEVDKSTGQYTRWQLDGGIERGTDPDLVEP